MGVDAKDFYCKVIKAEFSEREKSYVRPTQRISKDKLMKIDTIWLENSEVVRYHTYCLPEQKEAAIEMLRRHIIAKVTGYHEKINHLTLMIQKKISVIEIED